MRFVELEVDGQKARVAISRFSEGLTDWRPFWRGYFAPAFYLLLTRNLETDGSSVGGYAPLNPRYAAWKAQRYQGKTILRRTDRLFHSFEWQGNQPGPEGVFDAREDALTIGSDVPYWRYHQRGTPRLPRRPILFLAHGASETLGRQVHRWAVDEAKKARVA